MAVCVCVCWVLLLWPMLGGSHGDGQPTAEEVEIFHSEKLGRLGWTSDPGREWVEVRMSVGAGGSSVPVLQACGKRVKRSMLSPSFERGHAPSLLMDLAFAQEAEPAGELHHLQVELQQLGGGGVVRLQSSRPFPSTMVPQQQLAAHLEWRRALQLGPLTHSSFRLRFSFTGTCVLVASIRLYYRRCPHTLAGLVWFGSAGASREPLPGSCVDGAVEVSAPMRVCQENGTWGPLLGGCTCKPGYQVLNNHTCQACQMGEYKPANQTACRPCPPNSGTHGGGSESCHCLPGFARLLRDPAPLGCTKPPSAPVNLMPHHLNRSVLLLTWDGPHQRGGRAEVTYDVLCEAAAVAMGDGRGWEACGDHEVLLPRSSGLTNTSVIITGLRPHRDYRLSVQARNDLSALPGAPPAPTATVTIHTWNHPPAVVTEGVGLIKEGVGLITEGAGLTLPDGMWTPAPQRRTGFSTWLRLLAAVCVSGLMLMTLISIGLCVRRINYHKIRWEPDVELLPMNPGVVYRRPLEAEAAPLQAPEEEGAAQLLEGLGGNLLDGLKDVLIERNKLTLGKELGKGEYGSVYKGVFTPEEGQDLRVAVKTMRVGIHNQEDLHEFLREAEIMKNFQHENVVGLLGVTLQREEDWNLPVPLLILPYMKHGDLRRFLIATRYGDIPMFVPHQSLLRFMIDIAAGMDHLSSQGFLHRDLAARNCMLSNDLRVCVADFGLSKRIHSSNYYRQTAAVRLPIKWMSVESLSESLYTTKTDVWSFGVTMWEIVSRGRTPYAGVHNHELLDLLLSGHRLTRPEDCDHKLFDVMRSCWEKEPDSRPDFKQLGGRLKVLLSELPVLEASKEASYINQGLEAACGAAACQEPPMERGGRGENIYLPQPVTAAAATAAVAAAAAARDEEEDGDDGYLKYITGSAASAQKKI